MNFIQIDLERGYMYLYRTFLMNYAGQYLSLNRQCILHFWHEL